MRWALRFGLFIGVLGVAAAGVAWWATAPPAPEEEVRVFVARTIHTLEPEPVRAEAVAIQYGRIRAVGSREEVLAALVGEPYVVDERFADLVLTPGFIEPHLHPVLAATILPMDIVAAMPWNTPRGTSVAVRGHDAFLERLRALDAERQAAGDRDGWLTAWGYHAPFHGQLSRADLDRVSQQRPIFVWQRSVHEMYFNTRALEQLEMQRAAFDAHPQADWERGRLWERGALELGAPMLQVLAHPASFYRGLRMMRDVIHRGGITTVAEQGFPQVSALPELLLLHAALRRRDTPFRFVLVPNAMHLLRTHGNTDAAVAGAQDLLGWSSERIRVVRHAKTYSDGAIFSLLMQMSEPYTDGHHGEWLMPPEQHEEALRAFWNEGWDLHVHVNGDAGLDSVLDQIDRIRADHPRPNGRVVLEHYGYARDDQHARVRALDTWVSNNAYYVHELAAVYAQEGLGPERAAHISPLGGLAREGVPTSFHSDFPMAPAEPLLLMWAAVNRISSDGAVWGPEERLSAADALRAVTLEGARSLGLEDEIGSIAPGKRADFTVLHEDPLGVAPHALRDIRIWGTVLDGHAHPL